MFSARIDAIDNNVNVVHSWKGEKITSNGVDKNIIVKSFLGGGGIYIYIYIFIHVHIHTYIHTYIYIYIYIYMFTFHFLTFRRE